MGYIEGWEVAALSAATAIAGLGQDGWEFVRTSRSRAIFRSVEAGLFAKLTTPEGVVRMATEAVFARWAERAGVPAVALASEVPDQPVIGPFGAATFWPLHRVLTMEEVDMAWMGAALGSLHSRLDPPPVPAWAPRAGIDERFAQMGASGQIPPSLLATLESKAARILAQAESLTQGLAPVVLHGDAFPDNVVAASYGLLLVDFEQAQIGPAAYDLAPTLVLARRFGFPEDAAAELIRAYGPVDPAALETMVELTELVITSGAIGLYACRHELFRQELAVRANSLGDGGVAGWTSHHRLLQQLPASEP